MENPVEQWTTFTPDGRRLAVSRHGHLWTVVCGDSDEARSEFLDIALIEAIRRQADVASHSMKVDYATWTRALADRLERESEQIEKGRPNNP
jgi:hypothetical protein